MKLKKLDLLIAFYITCLVISEAMGAKTFPLVKIFNYQLNASVAIITIPIIFTINDVITEVYGKERTRSIIRSGLFMIVFLMLFSVFATSVNPSTRFANSEASYDLIFHKSLRISAASLIAFTLAEFMDVFIFTRIRTKLGRSRLWLRNNLSNWIAQLLDTNIFMFLAFYEISDSFNSNFEFLIGLIIPYWLLKCFMSVIETPFVYAGVRWLKGTKFE